MDPGVMAAIEQAIEPPVSRGIRLITAGDLRGANTSFREAAESGPADADGNLLYAVTRIATLLFDDPRLAVLRERAGVNVTGDITQLCGIIVDLPVVSTTVDELPDDAPSTAEVQRALKDVLLPELLAARQNISSISDDFVLTLDLEDLPLCIRPTTGQATLEIDHADVLLLDAALEAASAAFDLGDAYDLDTELRPLVTAKEREVFEQAPELFTLSSAAPLPSARGALESALEKFEAALAAIRAEKDDQSDDLLVITPGNEESAAAIGMSFELLRMSFSAAVTLPTTIGLIEPGRLDLRLFFAGQLATLRPLFPRFDDDGNFLCSTCFDDPTFGGALPDVQCEDPTLECSEIKGDVKGIVRNYTRLATDECTPCEFDEDCQGVLGAGNLGCFSCSFDCTGETDRCAPFVGYAQCDDGQY